MADEWRTGTLFLFSDKQPCETEGCEAETQEAIWNGERWRRTCEEHQRDFQNELRKQDD